MVIDSSTLQVPPFSLAERSAVSQLDISGQHSIGVHTAHDFLIAFNAFLCGSPVVPF
jgi:hypothetical protein